MGRVRWSLGRQFDTTEEHLRVVVDGAVDSSLRVVQLLHRSGLILVMFFFVEVGIDRAVGGSTGPDTVVFVGDEHQDR